jgi:hypothetical protein
MQGNNGIQKKKQGEIIERSETHRRKNKENKGKEILKMRTDCVKDVQEF